MLNQKSCFIYFRLNSFNITFFAFFRTQTRAYGSSTVLQVPPHLLTLKVNRSKRVSSLSTSVGPALHGCLFRDTHFIGPLEWKANNYLLKLPIAQELNNPISVFKNKSKHYFISCLFTKYLWYPEYHQHHYYHNRLENHIHIHIIESFSNDQLKFYLKHYPNIMELHLLQNLCFECVCFNTVNK